MSDLSLKSFNDAFANASRKGASLTDDHKEQLDKLQEIVDAINAEGTCKAELGDWLRHAPGLDITPPGADRPVTFQVVFGYDPMGGTPTIALTTTAARTPVGKPEGYCLQYATDREKFLKELGEAVAKISNGHKLSQDALAYATRKNTPAA